VNDSVPHHTDGELAAMSLAELRVVLVQQLGAVKQDRGKLAVDIRLLFSAVKKLPGKISEAESRVWGLRESGELEAVAQLEKDISDARYRLTRFTEMLNDDLDEIVATDRTISRVEELLATNPR
jgi:hypothetical protein